MAAVETPQRHNDHFRDVFLLRTDLAFFFLGFHATEPELQVLHLSLDLLFSVLGRQKYIVGMLELFDARTKALAVLLIEF
jgi:hypothetical protein